MNTTTSRPRYPWPFPEPMIVPSDGDASAWRDSPLPDKREWKEAFEDLFNGAGSLTYLKRAERLAGYGLSPQALREVCANPRSVASLPDSDQRPASDVEAFAALAHEAALYYSIGYGMAREAEVSYARRLISLGWLQPQVASLLGVTKQRMSKLLKQKRTALGTFPGLAGRTDLTQEPDPAQQAEASAPGRGERLAQGGRLASIFERSSPDPEDDSAPAVEATVISPEDIEREERTWRRRDFPA